MSVQNPLKLELPDGHPFEDVRGDGTRLAATVEFLGVFHHLTLIRAVEVKVDSAGNRDRGRLGWAADHTEWEAADDEDQDDLENLDTLYAADFDPVELPDFPGQYIAYMVPFDR